jgi:hypothetical protein
MYDISVVVGVISMIDATCEIEPYLSSWTFVSKLSLCGETTQITRKYKIRTKYDDNLRFYKNRESRKTPFV